MPPDFTMVVGPDVVPVAGTDITRRYKAGIAAASASADLIMFIEDDDWYGPRYIETMYYGWLEAGSPQCFGWDRTTYYHIVSRKHMTNTHKGRSSAMNTMITSKSISHIGFPLDSEPFFDLHVWKSLKGKSVTRRDHDQHCIGIKHGVGMTGGKAHDKDWRGFTTEDPDMFWLKERVNRESFELYSNKEKFSFPADRSCGR